MRTYFVWCPDLGQDRGAAIEVRDSRIDLAVSCAARRLDNVHDGKPVSARKYTLFMVEEAGKTYAAKVRTMPDVRYLVSWEREK